MSKIFLCFFIAFTTIPSAFSGLGDELAKAFFQKKVDELYQKALQCSPLEKDTKFKIDVRDWIKIQPPLPEWQKLTAIEDTAKAGRDYARSIGGKDKVLHCLAGCYIAKKLDYTSAVLVGWYKELADSSDCSNKTSFEKKDYDATVIGARAGEEGKECDRFCKK